MKKYLIFACCFFVFACKSTTETGAPTVIMPLAVGNEWDYAGFFWISPTDQRQFYDTTKIVSSMGTDFATQFGTYYENKTDGLWIVKDSLTPSFTRLIAKYPANIGDIVRHDTAIGKDTLIAEDIVDSVNAIVTVPSGIYSCFKYSANYYNSKHILQSQDNEYYAVNVGEIKEDLFLLDSVSHQLILFLTRQLTKVILH